MSATNRTVTDYLKRLLDKQDVERLKKQLEPDFAEAALRLPRNHHLKPELIERRWAIVAKPEAKADLLDAFALEHSEVFAHNIENFIGTVKLPVGLAGPIRINGLFAKGDYFLPLATTEAALVLSYHRGCNLLTAAGGATTLLLSESVSRAPGFAFENLIDVGEFLRWAAPLQPKFKELAEATTRFGKLLDMHFTVEGNHVYLRLDYLTGDAAGQNMVTIATEAVVDYITEHCPIPIKYSFLEANLSGDKKASSQSFMGVRGKKVSAEVVIAKDLLEKTLHTTPERMVDYWRMSSVGGILSGTIGIQGHYANGLAALYISCGQDAACISESAVGITRFELKEDGSLYAAVTLPNLIVGTVGGGTDLPSQKACLDIMGLAGSGHARAFAEVCAGLALAGELSIVGALCAGQFSRAHERLARDK
ncbi:MAG: hydroxymethylglutaryl-CoA reductase [Trueperaceae bacterium]|nr:hydroxymethylglutaryl-CoA reductase [Trueperaceae bacterium]